MELCAMNCHYRFYTIEDFFKYSHKNGFKKIELWTGPMHFFMDYDIHDSVKKIKELEQKYDVKVIGICPEQTNPKPNNMAISSSEGKKRTFHYFRNAIDVADELNARQVVVTSGWAYLTENKQEARNRSALMLRRLTEYAQSKSVVLCIEALQPRESVLVNSANDLKNFLALVKHENIKVCLDFGAMACMNDSIKNYFELLGNDIVHCHFVDGDPVGHMAWGDGKRNMKMDLISLKENGYDGNLSLEIVNSRYFDKPFKADNQSKKLFDMYIKEIEEC